MIPKTTRKIDLNCYLKTTEIDTREVENYVNHL